MGSKSTKAVKGLQNIDTPPIICVCCYSTYFNSHEEDDLDGEESTELAGGESTESGEM